MLRVLLLSLFSCLLLATSPDDFDTESRKPPRNFNAEYRTGHSVYSIAQELKANLKLSSRDYPLSINAAEALENATHLGIIDIILESGGRTRLNVRCAMKWYGNIVDETYDVLSTSFDGEYRDSNSTDKKTYRWMVNRLDEANDALQRAIGARGRSVDCSSCQDDSGSWDGSC